MNPYRESLKQLVEALDAQLPVPLGQADLRATIARSRTLLAQPVIAGSHTFYGGYIIDDADEKWWSAGIVKKLEAERDEAIEKRKRLEAELDEVYEHLSGDGKKSLMEVVVDLQDDLVRTMARSTEKDADIKQLLTYINAVKTEVEVCLGRGVPLVDNTTAVLKAIRDLGNVQMNLDRVQKDCEALEAQFEAVRMTTEKAGGSLGLSYNDVLSEITRLGERSAQGAAARCLLDERQNLFEVQEKGISLYDLKSRLELEFNKPPEEPIHFLRGAQQVACSRSSAKRTTEDQTSVTCRDCIENLMKSSQMDAALLAQAESRLTVYGEAIRRACAAEAATWISIYGESADKHIREIKEYINGLDFSRFKEGAMQRVR